MTDLNHLTIPGAFRALLYKDQLISLRPEPGEAGKPPAFLGNRERNIVVIVSDPDAKFINERDWKFFTDLLNACELTVADIALVNCFHTPARYGEIEKAFRPSSLLVFGVSARQLDMPVNLPDFQVQPFGEGHLLMCPSLAAIQPDKELKKQLWGALKKIFNLKKKP